MTGGSINLKPNRPDIFDKGGEFLVVNTWLFNIEQYLALFQLNAPNTPISDEKRIRLTSLHPGGLILWWRTLFGLPGPKSRWQLSEISFLRTITNVRETASRQPRQKKSVSHYLVNFPSVIVTIQEMTDNEKINRFISQDWNRMYTLKFLKQRKKVLKNAHVWHLTRIVPFGWHIEGATRVVQSDPMWVTAQSPWRLGTCKSDPRTSTKLSVIKGVRT